MDGKNFVREKKRIFCYCIAYGVLCEVISLFVIGFNLGFATGIICGIAAMMINMRILEMVVDSAMSGNKIGLTFLLQLGRFFIYGILGYACYKLSVVALIAYAIGVLGFVVGAVLTYRKKEGEDAKF